MSKNNVIDDLNKDSGYSSRKFWMTIIAMGLIMVSGILSGLALFSGLSPMLPVVVGGILGALTVYAGANTATKFAAASIAKASDALEPAEPQEPLK
jgi:uncharacterized membrane protein YhaH (DUF805 family)